MIPFLAHKGIIVKYADEIHSAMRHIGFKVSHRTLNI